MSIQYASNIRVGHTNAPDGFTQKQWHQDAIGDTRTSHCLPGRLYLVQCEWCDSAFAAKTKVEAMTMFRAHEAEMLAAVSTSTESDE